MYFNASGRVIPMNDFVLKKTSLYFIETKKTIDSLRKQPKHLKQAKDVCI